MSQERKYNNRAERQAAYRQRSKTLRLGHVQMPPESKTRAYGVPVASGAILAHQAVAGLLLAPVAAMPGDRMLATVVRAGDSGLIAGQAYPFRRELLREVGS